jgi:hypothetical protein
MSALANLKLVAAKRPVQLPPVVQRRNKVVNRLAEQIELAKAKRDGKTYSPTRLRRVKDEETGASKTVEMPKRLKEWWFVAESGKLCVSLKYGAKTVEIAKGKTAVEIANEKELVATLEVLKQAVESGELDSQIEVVSGAGRIDFKK